MGFQSFEYNPKTLASLQAARRKALERVKGKRNEGYQRTYLVVRHANLRDRVGVRPSDVLDEVSSLFLNVLNLLWSPNASLVEVSSIDVTQKDRARYSFNSRHRTASNPFPTAWS